MSYHNYSSKEIDNNDEDNNEHKSIRLISVPTNNDRSSPRNSIDKDYVAKEHEVQTGQLLSCIQYLQDLLIASQRKFKAYEEVSEYSNYDDLEIFEKKNWKRLSDSEIESCTPKLTESFANTFKNVYLKMTNMDVAVSRLRYSNDKLTDELKLMKLAEKRGCYDSSDRRFKTEDCRRKDGESLNDLVEELESKKQELQKKNKTLKSKLKDCKSDIEEFKNDIEGLEKKKNNFQNEIKKLKKSNKELQTEIDSYGEDVVRKLQKEIKNLQKEISFKDQEIKEISEKNSSKDLATQIELLIASTTEKEMKKLKKSEEAFEELKSIKVDINQLKEINEAHSTRKDEINDLKDQVNGLQKQNSKHVDVNNLLNNQIKTLEGTMLQKDMINKTLQCEISKLSELNKTNLADSERNINTINVEVVRLNEEIEFLKLECRKAEFTCEGVRKSNDDLKQIIESNEQKNRGASEKQNKLLESYRNQISMLQRTLHAKERDQLAREQGLVSKIEEIEDSKQNQIEWMSREIDSVICKCYEINTANQYTRSPDSDSIEMNSLNEERMKNRLQTQGIRKEDQHSSDYQPLHAESGNNDTFESVPDYSLIEKIRELEEIIKKKDIGFENVKGKLKPSMENELRLKAEKEILEKQIEELHVDITKLKEENEQKRRAVMNMKEKMKNMTVSLNSSENSAEFKKELELIKIEKIKIENELSSVSDMLRKSREECENLKKIKTRLELEIEHLKTLNFKKKAEDSL